MKRLLLALPLLLAACDRRDSETVQPKVPPAVSRDQAKDPLCGMMVDKATALKITHEGTNYYFCAEECMKKFQADPKKHATLCVCGKVSKKCPCEHCGGHLGGCDCRK